MKKQYEVKKVESKQKYIPRTIQGVEVGEYQGYPVISLPLKPASFGSAFQIPFTFGLAKAKVILDYLEDIRAFVLNQESEVERESTDEEIGSLMTKSTETVRAYQIS